MIRRTGLISEFEPCRCGFKSGVSLPPLPLAGEGWGEGKGVASLPSSGLAADFSRKREK